MYFSFDFVINFVLRYFSLEYPEAAVRARSIVNFSVKFYATNLYWVIIVSDI